MRGEFGRATTMGAYGVGWECPAVDGALVIRVGEEVPNRTQRRVRLLPAE